MSKNISLIILFVLLFAFISSEQQANNSLNTTKNKTKDFSFTLDIDPFDAIDFGNLIWLSDANATSEIEKHEIIFVFFYYPWCDPCLNLLPIYIQAAFMADEKKLGYKFAKINGMNNTKTSELFELREFPSIYLVYKGQRIFYEGKRTSEAILKFVDRKKNDDIITFDSLEPIKEYINSSIRALLCTVKDEKNELRKSFKKLSKEINNIDFIVCTSEECIKEYEENIVLFKEFDEKINIYTKEMGPIKNATSNSLKEFLGTYSIQSGCYLTVNEFNMMMEYSRNMITYYRNETDENQTKYDNVMKEVGIELRKNKIYAVTSDIQGDPVQEEIASAYMVLPMDLPAILVYDQNIHAIQGGLANLYIIRNIKEEQLTKEYILKYVNDIIAGKIKKTLFSEPPLENYYEDGLEIIIGRNFDSDVIENKNNVLLALTNAGVPSKATDNVIGIMKRLAKKYNAKDDKIVFAYSNAQKNEPRDVVISGKKPPIVLLYTNALEEKKKIEFKPDNFTTTTEEELENFLMKNLGWKEKKEYKEPEIKKEEIIKEEKKDEKKEENKEGKKDEDKKNVQDKEKDKKEEDKKVNTDL